MPYPLDFVRQFLLAVERLLFEDPALELLFSPKEREELGATERGNAPRKVLGVKRSYEPNMEVPEKS